MTREAPRKWTRDLLIVVLEAEDARGEGLLGSKVGRGERCRIEK